MNEAHPVATGEIPPVPVDRRWLARPMTVLALLAATNFLVDIAYGWLDPRIREEG